MQAELYWRPVLRMHGKSGQGSRSAASEYRLTPLIERLAENNLDAELKLARAELQTAHAASCAQHAGDLGAVCPSAAAGEAVGKSPAYIVQKCGGVFGEI